MGVLILDKIIPFMVDKSENIASLKNRIQTMTGIPPERQILSFVGTVLEDGVFIYLQVH